MTPAGEFTVPPMNCACSQARTAPASAGPSRRAIRCQAVSGAEVGTRGRSASVGNCCGHRASRAPTATSASGAAASASSRLAASGAVAAPGGTASSAAVRIPVGASSSSATSSSAPAGAWSGQARASSIAVASCTCRNESPGCQAVFGVIFAASWSRSPGWLTRCRSWPRGSLLMRAAWVSSASAICARTQGAVRASPG